MEKLITIKEYLMDTISANAGIEDRKLVATGNTYFNGTEERDCDIYDDYGELESVIIGLRECEVVPVEYPDDMDVKQVIVVRKDLGMRKGKMIAQGAHASLGAVFANSYLYGHEKRLIMTPELETWFNDGFTKIALSVDSEDELHKLHKQAHAAGLLTCLIRDAGRTEFNGEPTYTALAIGPGISSNIDLITGDLKLL